MINLIEGRKLQPHIQPDQESGEFFIFSLKKPESAKMAGEEEDKKADEDKDLELDLMAEAELLRLTRQYRIMEGDKEAYCEEAQKVLRRQRKILTDLGKVLELLSDHIYLWSVVSGVGGF